MDMKNIISSLALASVLISPNVYSQDKPYENKKNESKNNNQDTIDVCEEVKKCEQEEKPTGPVKAHCSTLFDGEGWCMPVSLGPKLGAEKSTAGYCPGTLTCHDVSDVENIVENIGELKHNVKIINGKIVVLEEGQEKNKQKIELLEKQIINHDKLLVNLDANIYNNAQGIGENSERIGNLEEDVAELSDKFSFALGLGFQYYGVPAFVPSIEGCYNSSVIPGMSFCLNMGVPVRNQEEFSTETSLSRTEDVGDGYTVDHFSNEKVATSQRYFLTSGLSVHQILLSAGNYDLDLNFNGDVHFGNRSVTTTRTADNQLNYSGKPLGEPHHLSEEETVDDIRIGVGLTLGLQNCYNNLGPLDLCGGPKFGVLIDTLNKEVSPLIGVGGYVRF